MYLFCNNIGYHSIVICDLRSQLFLLLKGIAGIQVQTELALTENVTLLGHPVLASFATYNNNKYI